MFTEGTKVVAKATVPHINGGEVENFHPLSNVFLPISGLTGTVTESRDDFVAILVDGDEIPALMEWENEIHYYDEDCDPGQTISDVVAVHWEVT